MANPDSTQSAVASEYIEDPIDSLTKKSAQLYAMLSTTYGAGFESFNSYNDTIKDNYLWACADLARDIEKLSDHIASNGIKIGSNRAAKGGV
jgi:hypothetical protein